MSCMTFCQSSASLATNTSVMKSAATVQVSCRTTESAVCRGSRVRAQSSPQRARLQNRRHLALTDLPTAVAILHVTTGRCGWRPPAARYHRSHFFILRSRILGTHGAAAHRTTRTRSLRVPSLHRPQLQQLHCISGFRVMSRTFHHHRDTSTDDASVTAPSHLPPISEIYTQYVKQSTFSHPIAWRRPCNS